MNDKTLRARIIEACHGDLKQAAIHINRLQERHWLQVARLSTPWPGDASIHEEPGILTPLIDSRANELQAGVNHVELRLHKLERRFSDHLLSKKRLQGTY